MNREEFAASTPPGRRRSRLHPHAADLLALQADGYTLAQLRDFLAGNDVTSCKSNIHRFLERQRRAKAPEATRAQGAAEALPAPLVRPAPGLPAPTSPALANDARPGAGDLAEPFSARAIRNKTHNLTELADAAKRAKANRIQPV